jgi:hypothetical protein
MRESIEQTEGTASINEIEVTPEMVRAGVTAYYRRDEYFEPIEDVVAAIFFAMIEARSVR